MAGHLPAKKKKILVKESARLFRRQLYDKRNINDRADNGDDQSKVIVLACSVRWLFDFCHSLLRQYIQTATGV